MRANTIDITPPPPGKTTPDMSTQEVRDFWKSVYIAAVQLGRPSHLAAENADAAVAALRSRLD